MPNKSDEPRKTQPKQPGEAQGAKKPSALLDLKATEVKTPGSSAAASPPQSPASGSSPAKAGTAGASSGSIAGAPSSAGNATPAAAAGAAPPGQASGKTAAPGSEAPKGAASVAAAGFRPAAAKEGAGAGTGGSRPQPGAQTAPVTQPHGGTGVWSHAAAGLAGGVLALMLGLAVGSVLGWPTSETTYPANVVDDLRRRMAAVEKTLSEPARDSAAAELSRMLAGVEGRLGRIDEVSRKVDEVAGAQSALADRTKSLEERSQQTQPATDLTERVARLEQTIASLKTAAASDPQAGRIPQLVALSGKLNDLEATLANQLAALRKSVAQDIDARVTPAQEASEAAKSAAQRIDRELSAIKAEAARLAQRAETLKVSDDTLQAGLKALQEEAAGIRGALGALKGDLGNQLKGVTRPQDLSAAVTPLSDKIAAMEQSLQGVLKNEDERKANAERVVLALEIGNLKRAIDRGAKFSRELAAVQQMGGRQIDLSALERFKDQGIPTQSDLVREFRTISSAMIDAENTPPGTSTLDRLLQGARSVVRVRRTDHRNDDLSAEAIIARMEKALAEDRIGDVLAESGRLSPQAMAPAADWLARVEAREAADRALARIEDQLKASMSGKTQPDKRS